MKKYQINEIFSSLQGEGFNTGRPVVFVRLANCNLRCNWCDTRFYEYEEMTLAQILDLVQSFSLHSVIITGGEPTISDDYLELARAFKEQNYWLALETNGVNGLPKEARELFDYLVVSPKSEHEELYRDAKAADFADEVRVVVDGEVQEFCEFIEQRIVAKHYYLSPCCSLDENFNILQTIQILGKLNERGYGKEWGLSIQTHKLANIQ